MGMTIAYRVSGTYIAAGDGRTTFPIPHGIETVEQIVVAGRTLTPGIDYSVLSKRRDHFAPGAFTLEVALAAGDNIYIVGINWR